MEKKKNKLFYETLGFSDKKFASPFRGTLKIGNDRYATKDAVSVEQVTDVAQIPASISALCHRDELKVAGIVHDKSHIVHSYVLYRKRQLGPRRATWVDIKGNVIGTWDAQPGMPIRPVQVSTPTKIDGINISPN